MAGRPRLTIACLLRERIVRVDCDRRGHCSPADTIEQPPVDHASGLRALLALRRPAPRVLVLLDDLWTQTVELAESAVVGLTHEDLRRALAFELEPVSGIAAATARIGVREAEGAPEGRRAFWTSQLGGEAAAHLEHEIVAAGARLLGIAPTCGLGLAAALPEGALRVEAWNGATFCGSLAGPERVIAGRVGQRYWLQAVEDWLGSQTGHEVHWAGSVRTGAGCPQTSATLDLGALPPLLSDTDAAHWLQGIAPILLHQHRDLLPCIGPAPHARRLRPGMVALVLALLTAMLLWYADHTLARRLTEQRVRLETLREERRQAEQQQRNLAEMQRRVGEREAANDAEADELAAIEALWQQQSSLIPHLLQAIAATRPLGVQVRSVRSSSGGRAEVAGIGTEPGVIDAFAAGLSLALREHGWSVTPAHSREQQLENGRSFHEFTTTVTPTAPPESPPPKPRRRS